MTEASELEVDEPARIPPPPRRSRGRSVSFSRSTLSAAQQAPAASIDLSVVIPLYNEELNIDPLLVELLAQLEQLSRRWEVILVDDGSNDGSAARAFAWSACHRSVRVVQLRRNFGQSAAIGAGVDAASGTVIVLMDGDQQNDPSDIPILLDKLAEGFDIVSGWRVERQDDRLKRLLPSRVANALISRVTGVALHDYGCTLKAYDAQTIRSVRFYGELHRFIPALATQKGARIAEIPVKHRPRTRGSSKYGISRVPRVLLDLLTVKFLVSYLDRPMQMFGKAAVAASGSLAVASFGDGVARRLRRDPGSGRGSLVQAITAVALLCVQLLTAGLLGEILMRTYFEGQNSRPYEVRTTAGFDEADERNEATRRPSALLAD